MAPFFQTTGAQIASIGTSVNVVWPTHIVNDIGLVVIETSGNSADLTPPAGWAALPGTPVTDVATTAGSKLHVWWKRAASSAEAAVATGAGTDHIIARLYTFRGCVTTGNPWNVITTGTKTTASTTATIPSLTTTWDDTLITMIVGRPDDSSSISHFGVPVNANLTSLAERLESGTVNGNGGGFVLSTGIKALSGATGTSTLTKTVSTTDTYVVLALKAPTVLITTVGAFNDNGINVNLVKSSVINGTTSTFSLVGNDADFSKPVLLDVSAGAFTYNGTTTGLLFNRNLIQQTGAFTLTGINAILARTVALDVTKGTFTLAGTATNINLQRAIVGSTGTFSIAGVDVTLQYNSSGIAFTLDTVVGAYSLTGNILTLNKQVTLNLQAGTYSLFGNTLGFIRALALHSVPGSFSVSGKDAVFSLTKRFSLTTGTYNVSGNTVGVNRFYQLNNQPGTYQVVGSDLDYFSSRNLVTLPLAIVTDFRSVGNFFWYQTTQKIQPVKYKITKRNEWILGRATHMGRRGL